MNASQIEADQISSFGNRLDNREGAQVPPSSVGLLTEGRNASSNAGGHALLRESLNNSPSDDFKKNKKEKEECPFCHEFFAGVNIHIGWKHPGAQTSGSGIYKQGDRYNCDLCGFASPVFNQVVNHKSLEH